MGELAWNLGVNGLLNPEDDAFHGAKEEWFVIAENAAYPTPAAEPTGWN